jgi:hypothetical protein
VYEIPDVGAAGKGKSMASLLNLQPGENVRNILPVRNLEEDGKFIFFATRKGTVKKTPLKDFSNVMARGIIAIGIDDDDELIGARLTDGNQIIFLATHEGMAIRFGEDDVRSMGRPAYGVRGIELLKNDYLVGLATTPKERKKNGDGEHSPSLILSITEQGYGKRTDVDEYRLQSRGGRGVINLKATARNGKVTAIRANGDQPIRKDHSHRYHYDPQGRTLDPGSASAASGRGRQGSGCGGHSAGRREDRTRKRYSAAIKIEGVLRVQYSFSKADGACCFLEAADSLHARLFRGSRVLAGGRVRVAAIVDLVAPPLGLKIQNILLADVHREEGRAILAEHRHFRGVHFAVELGVHADGVIDAVQKVPGFGYRLCARHCTQNNSFRGLNFLVLAHMLGPALGETIRSIQAENHRDRKLFHKPSLGTKSKFRGST